MGGPPLSAALLTLPCCFDASFGATIKPLLEEELALLFERVARGGLPPFLQNVQDPKATFAKFCEPRLQRYRAWADMIVPVYPTQPTGAGRRAAEYLSIRNL